MASQAEAIQISFGTEPHDDTRTGVYLAEAAEFEPQVQAEFRHWLGSMATGAAYEASRQPKVNILERLHEAKAGSPEALAWVKINVDTAIFEAVFKDGYIGRTYMDRNVAGELTQFGQTNDSIYRNAMLHRPNRHEILQGITKVEALNRLRIEAALKEGVLKDHYFVAASLVPNDVPEKDLGSDGDGYFLEGLTLNLQATTELDNGRVKTSTAFIPGVEAEAGDTFENRLAKRHDFKAMNLVRGQWGLKRVDTAEEQVHGFFVHKEMMPNGIADLTYRFAKAGDAILGRNVDRSVGDYLSQELESRRKEASLKTVREKVLERVLEAADSLESPMGAIGFMWELVREYAVEESFTNENIDPEAFGHEAAPAIREIRRHLQNGDMHAAQLLTGFVARTARVTGCGGGSGRGPKPWWGAKDWTKEQQNENEEEDLSYIAGKDDLGSRAFRCRNGHINIRPKNETIPACKHHGCKAKVACGPA